MERYAEFGVDDVDIGGGTKEFVQERAALIVAASVVRAEERNEVALVAALASLGARAAAREELDEPVACGTKLLANLAVSDLEAAHGGAAPLGVVHRRRTIGLLQLGDLGVGIPDLLVQDASLGVGHGASRVVRLDLVVGERVEQEFLAQVLEEVLLPPALEHAVGDLDVGEVPPTGDHLGLVPVLAQARDLPETQRALEEADGLVVQAVLDRAAVHRGVAQDEAMRTDAAGLALA